MRILDLSACDGVTPDGWDVLVDVLHNTDSALELIDLSNNIIDNQVMVSFADALANNNTLKGLMFGCYVHGRGPQVVTSIDNEAAFTRSLCNTSSIVNTYNSNHTLENLCLEYFHTFLPASTISLLRINKESSKSQAARIKIINTHFSGSNINTQVFTEMDVRVRPVAIDWMGRDQGSNETSDLLFAFIRNVPSLCDTTSKSKKREMSRQASITNDRV